MISNNNRRVFRYRLWENRWSQAVYNTRPSRRAKPSVQNNNLAIKSTLTRLLIEFCYVQIFGRVILQRKSSFHKPNGDIAWQTQQKANLVDAFVSWISRTSSPRADVIPLFRQSQGRNTFHAFADRFDKNVRHGWDCDSAARTFVYVLKNFPLWSYYDYGIGDHASPLAKKSLEIKTANSVLPSGEEDGKRTVGGIST